MQYDPHSSNEEPLPIPEESVIKIMPQTDLFPPRTRRGHGPGLITLLNRDEPEERKGPAPLDPTPPIKWAEEGFAVFATVINDDVSVAKALEVGVKTLMEREEVDNKNHIGIVGACSLGISQYITLNSINHQFMIKTCSIKSLSR